MRAVALAAILPLSVACQKATTATEDAAPATTTSASTVATDTAAASASVVPPLPALSANLTPSAVASVKQAAIGRDGGTSDPALLAALSSDAGFLALLGAAPDAGGLVSSPGIGAYGAAPPPGLGPGIGAYGAAPGPGLGGLLAGNVSTSMSGAHTTGDDRMIATKRPMMRACYTKGLQANPDMSGKLKLSVSVSATGAAKATVVSASGNLGEDVKQCMTRAVDITPFEPTAHTFDVEITATNK